jgi:Tat protein secretion system quality control protein TatD with DNase activity
LDYFHVEKDTADWQRERFRRHIAASNQSGKPMIIHTQTHKNSSTDKVLACANRLSILPPKTDKSTLSK